MCALKPCNPIHEHVQRPACADACARARACVRAHSTKTKLYIIDSFNGPERDGPGGAEGKHFVVECPDRKATMSAGSFSADGRFVSSGGSNGAVYTWAMPPEASEAEPVLLATPDLVATWKFHPFEVGVVRWNPASFSCVSTCSALTVWLPPDDRGHRP